jgi:hypothetical protein
MRTAVCCSLLWFLAVSVPSCLSFETTQWTFHPKPCHRPAVFRHKLFVPKNNRKESKSRSQLKSPLLMTADISNVKEMSPPPPPLAKAYQLSSFLFGVMSLVLLAIPDKTLTKRLASKWGGAAGFGLASYLSYILQQQRASASCEKETKTDSDNDTYKRANLGLLGFCVFGLVALPGEAGFWPQAAPAIVTAACLTAVRVFGAIVAYRGWHQGIVASGVNPMRELWNGTKGNLRGLRVLDKKKSLFYRNTLLLVLFGMFSNWMEGLFGLRVSCTVLWILYCACIGSF